jgi:hypothetical protein
MSKLAVFTFGGFLVVWYTSGDADAAPGCPPTYEGKPLRQFDVMDGPPGTGQPQAPEGNCWTIYPIPRTFWDRYPAFYLSCKYRGARGMVSVELPRSTRTCEILKGPNVQCH